MCTDKYLQNVLSCIYKSLSPTCSFPVIPDAFLCHGGFMNHSDRARWCCPNRECGWSMVGTLSEGEEEPPRCICGGLMERGRATALHYVSGLSARRSADRGRSGSERRVSLHRSKIYLCRRRRAPLAVRARFEWTFVSTGLFATVILFCCGAYLLTEAISDPPDPFASGTVVVNGRIYSALADR
jgi:hypothetical protein